MASVGSCSTCDEPLVLEVNDSDDESDVDMAASSSGNATAAETVPDDVQLGCGCHFHWQCLMDSISDTRCPNCSNNITSQGSGGPVILARIHNEGGLVEGEDLLPTLTEEAYCNAHPAERKPRAFLEFCRNGDLPAIVEMLQDEDEAEGTSMISNADLLRYHDPLGKKQSGLHAAVGAKSREVVWLLLLLASRLDLQQFPAEVFQEAGVLGIMREDDEVAANPDIRSFVDAEGRTAEQLAGQVGVPFHDWIGHGILGI